LTRGKSAQKTYLHNFVSYSGIRVFFGLATILPSSGLRSALFWNVTRRRVVIVSSRIRPLKMGPRAVESVNESSDSDSSIFKTPTPTPRFLKLRLRLLDF
jgi:hypothetical protein